MPGWNEAYPALNRALAPEYRLLPQEQVEAVVHEVFGEGVTLAAAEGFLSDIGRTLSRAASAAAPVLQRALPGLASGALGGAALGPLGMLGGAILGGVGAAMGGGGSGATPPRPPGVPAPAAAGRPPLGAGVGPTAAIAQLLTVLGSPTMQQALASMLLGRAGARSVPTPAGSQLPVATATNLIGTLAGRASAEWEAVVPSAETQSFGEALDFAAPEARAAWVLEQLAPLEGVGAFVGESSDEAWIDELYDELDAELLTEEPEASFDESADESMEPEWSWAAHG